MIASRLLNSSSANMLILKLKMRYDVFHVRFSSHESMSMQFGFTSLMLACECGHVNSIITLLKHGADLYVTDNVSGDVQRYHNLYSEHRLAGRDDGA